MWPTMLGLIIPTGPSWVGRETCSLTVPVLVLRSSMPGGTTHSTWTWTGWLGGCSGLRTVARCVHHLYPTIMLAPPPSPSPSPLPELLLLWHEHTGIGCISRASHAVSFQSRRINHNCYERTACSSAAVKKKSA